MRLWERILGWRSEIRRKPFPDLSHLQTAFDLACRSGLDGDLFLLVVAQCEWWFRIYRPSDFEVERALRDRLQRPGYSPFRPPPIQSPHVLGIVNSYTDQCLKRYWDDFASEQSRFVLKARIPELVREFARPFLVTECRTLPPKQGGYPRMAPWVAATVLYRSLRHAHPQKQSSIPVSVAKELVWALTGRHVDAPDFHAKRREIETRGTPLVETLLDFYRRITQDYLDPHQYVKELISEGPYHSLNQAGGWRLLTGLVTEVDMADQKGKRGQGEEDV
jgi:hypothetical protein